MRRAFIPFPAAAVPAAGRVRAGRLLLVVLISLSLPACVGRGGADPGPSEASLRQKDRLNGAGERLNGASTDTLNPREPTRSPSY